MLQVSDTSEWLSPSAPRIVLTVSSVFGSSGMRISTNLPEKGARPSTWTLVTTSDFSVTALGSCQPFFCKRSTSEGLGESAASLRDGGKPACFQYRFHTRSAVSNRRGVCHMTSSHVWCRSPIRILPAAREPLICKGFQSAGSRKSRPCHARRDQSGVEC